MKQLAVILVLFLAACQNQNSWPVDELRTWDGKSERWVLGQLGSPSAERRLKQPISDIGEWEGLQDRLDKLQPSYRGEVRRLAWKKKDWNIAVFLFERDGTWMVLDALKWRDGVEL